MIKNNKLNKFSYICRYIYSSIYILYRYTHDNYCIIKHDEDDEDNEYYDNENEFLPDAYEIIDRY
jgi:hypothetical protein